MKNADATTDTRETSRVEGLSYAALGFAHALFSQTVAFYLLYFYTDILSIPAKVVTVLYLVSHIWDAANDQLLGLTMSNTKSKHGRSRPYLLWTAIPMGILSIAMFFVPDQSVTFKIVYAFMIYFIWDICDTLLTNASFALLPLMTKSTQERTLINAYHIFATVVGVLIISAFTLPLANLFGGGDWAMAEKGDSRLGFLLVMCMYSAIAIPLQLFAFKNIKERHYVKMEKPVTLKASLHCLFSQKQLLLFFFIFLLIPMANTFKNQSTVYYLNSVLKSPESISLFYFTGIGASMIMQLLASRIVKRAHTMKVVLMGMLGSLMSLTIMLIFNHSLAITFVGNILFGLSSALPANLVYVILADFIDQANMEYKSNFSTWLYATLNCGTKIGVAMGGAVCSMVLAYVNYTSETEPTQLVMKGITFNFLGGTMIAYGLAFILMYVCYQWSKVTPRIYER